MRGLPIERISKLSAYKDLFKDIQCFKYLMKVLLKFQIVLSH